MDIPIPIVDVSPLVHGTDTTEVAEAIARACRDGDYFLDRYTRDPLILTEDDQRERWDQSSVHAFQGPYGEYLLKKVGRVFPNLLDGSPKRQSP